MKKEHEKIGNIIDTYIRYPQIVVISGHVPTTPDKLCFLSILGLSHFLNAVVKTHTLFL